MVITYLLTINLIFFIHWTNINDDYKKRFSLLSKKTYNPASINLNNQAMSLVAGVDTLSESLHTDRVSTALILLDSAIRLDSTYYVAYMNKLGMYCKLGEKIEAVHLLERITTIDTTYAEGLEMLGNFYESMFLVNKADSCYQRSLLIQQKRYRETKNIFVRGEEIFLHLLLNNNAIADSLVKNLDSEFPKETKTVQDVKETFINFNRSEYISNICK